MADEWSQYARPATTPTDEWSKFARPTTDRPAIEQPEGSAASRFGGGLWDTTIGGLGHMAAGVFDLLNQAIKAGPGRPIDPTSPGAQMIGNIVLGHYEQAQKAKAAYDQGNHVEALGHTLATIVPLVGPAAAHAGERIGGSQPTYDRYGKVIQPGQAPDVAGGLGEATGLIGMSVAPEVAGRVLPESVRVTPKFNVTLNPVEQSAVNFLQEKGIPLTPGTVTGNKFLQAFESVVKKSPLGTTTASQFGRATEEGLTKLANELANEVHPEPISPELAGRAVSDRLKGKIADMGLLEDEAYRDAWQGQGEPQFTQKVPVRTRSEPELNPQTGQPTGQMRDVPVMEPVNMPVDLRDIKEQLKPIWDEMQWMPAAERASSAGYQAIKNILEGDDFIPAWQAERGLGGLKTMARVTNRSGVRNVSQGIGASIIPDLQEGIDAAVASTGDTAIRGLQKGRATHAQMMDVADTVEQLRDEPVQTLGKLTWQNDTGIDFLRKIEQQSPESMREIGRAYLSQLFDIATRGGGFSREAGILRQWQNLGPETKKILFPDRTLRANLDNFFQGAEIEARNPNPSGTEILRQATSMNPARWVAGGIGGKLLFNPRSGAIATEGLRIPLRGGRAAGTPRPPLSTFQRPPQP